jgi:hypothetical protein
MAINIMKNNLESQIMNKEIIYAVNMHCKALKLV